MPDRSRRHDDRSEYPQDESLRVMLARVDENVKALRKEVAEDRRQCEGRIAQVWDDVSSHRNTVATELEKATKANDKRISEVETKVERQIPPGQIKLVIGIVFGFIALLLVAFANNLINSQMRQPGERPAERVSAP